MFWILDLRSRWMPFLMALTSRVTSGESHCEIFSGKIEFIDKYTNIYLFLFFYSLIHSLHILDILDVVFFLNFHLSLAGRRARNGIP